MRSSYRSVSIVLAVVVGVVFISSLTGAASAILEPSSSVASTETTGNISIEISDSSNGNDTAYTDIVISSNDSGGELSPQERVLQITGKESASELTIGDVSNVITLYNRDSSRNSVSIGLDDVSNAITLYNRNR